MHSFQFGIVLSKSVNDKILFSYVNAGLIYSVVQLSETQLCFGFMTRFPIQIILDFKSPQKGKLDKENQTVSLIHFLNCKLAILCS